tara:strand:+ start:4553 stop:5482 length:930 start_codon:yes stop_codon:yes gene_type:complete
MFKKLVLLTFVFFSLQSHAVQTLNVVLDWIINPSHGPIIVAKQKGYFHDEGLNVILHEPTDPAMPAKLVAAKKFDLAVTYQESFTYDLVHHLPLMKVSTLISSPLNCVMVLKKSGITSLSQLDGKKLGYSIPSEIMTLDVMLAYKQKKAPKVQKIQVGWNISQSLLSGQVDAVSGGFRTVEKNQMNLHGEEVTLFYPEDYGVPQYDELIIVAHQKTKNIAAIQSFNRALTRAVQYISNHPDQAWLSFVSYDKKKLENTLNKRSWNDSLIRYDHRPGAIHKSRYITYAKYLKKHHIIKSMPDFSHAFLQQ